MITTVLAPISRFVIRTSCLVVNGVTKMGTVPHNVSNPHHMRMVRCSEKPQRASDMYHYSDISCSLPCIWLFDRYDVNFVDQYVNRLRSYTSEIMTFGSAAMHTAAEEVGGLEFATYMRRLGLLSSPHRVEHERMKTCARYLVVHIERMGDDKKTKVCRELEMYMHLLR